MNAIRGKEIKGMFDGPIVPLSIRIAAPMLIGQVVQMLYFIIDTVFIARIDPSSTAIISGTGLAFPLFFMVFALGISISVGVSTITGRIIGANRIEEAPRVLASGLLVSIVIATPAIILGYLFGHPFLHFLAGDKLSDEAINYGLQFFYFILPGFGLMLISQAFFGMLQGEGRTDTVAKSMVVSTLLNILLDPILIFHLRLGVAGAGIATSISIAVAMIYALVMFKGKGSRLPLTFNIARCKTGYLKEVLRIGFPNFLSLAAMSVSFMVLNKIVGGIGQAEMNGWALVGRMDQIVLIPSFALSGATIAMISQNYGRGNIDRVKKIYRTNIRFGIAAVIAVAGVYMLGSPFFFPIFSNVPEVVNAAVRQVHYVALTFVGVSVAIISTSAFQATGKPLPALAISLVRMGLVAIPLAFFLVYVMHMGMLGMFLSLMIGNLAAMPVAYYWTKGHLRRLKPAGSVGASQ
jgi:putative MATE family efflux protein